MHTCLVVCYSRTGLTARVGQELADLYGADFELIREERSRSGPIGFLRCILDSVLRKQPEIVPPVKDPRDYALVILGAPVWAGTVAAPMRTYLSRHHERFHRIALFCTLGGSGGDKALDEMTALCGKQPAATLAIADAEIQSGSYRGKLASLGCAQPALT